MRIFSKGDSVMYIYVFAGVCIEGQVWNLEREERGEKENDVLILISIFDPGIHTCAMPTHRNTTTTTTTKTGAKELRRDEASFLRVKEQRQTSPHGIRASLPPRDN